MRYFRYLKPGDNFDILEIIANERDIEKWWNSKSKTFTDNAKNKIIEEFGSLENVPLEEKIKVHMEFHQSEEITWVTVKS